jgi:YVTN family beta-propeller protein
MRVGRTLMIAAWMLASADAARAQGALTGTLAVVNRRDGTVSLVDLATKQITATIPVGEGPHEVAISPDGAWAVVSNYGPTGAPGATLSLIDIAAGSVETTIPLGKHRSPHGLAWTKDGSQILATVESDSALLVIDRAGGTIAADIHLGRRGPDLIALSADSSRAFVTALGGSNVNAVDLATQKVTSSAELPPNADGIAVRPGSDELWVASQNSDKLTVLGLSDLAPRATIASAGYPLRVRFTPDGATALAIFGKSSELKFFDAATRKETATIPMRVSKAAMRGDKGAEGYENHTVPLGLSISPDGKWAFVANGGADALTIVSIAKRDVITVIFVGREPDGVAYTPLVRATATE